ncbi:unnamed protein product [Rotaria sp. Silwood1]|nr:unnamed protein product [Rotaria sp. Silwood1]
MLTPLLDRAVIPDLKKLIDYWKIHERIAHIRQGSINVLRHLQGQTTNEPSSPLNAAPDITQEPSGATCYEGYENYCINYSQRYSDDALKLIAQYSSSAELLAFVHSLNENEGDSLLEAANDFDETLTDTKTMVDFAVLKTFIDRAYANIKRAKRKTTATPLSLEDVIAAFQTLMNEPEFKNILECFEPCSKSLESIKRIHADSTNKGQSKRKRIFDIMADSSFTFIHESINVSGHVDDRFDVKSQKQSMRYDDLSELRDRARLIEYSNNKIKNETDREIEELHMFVILVDTIETILSILTSLYMAGHPYVLEFLASRKVFESPKHGINRSDNETNDVFALLRRIPVENQYRHFADSILTRFQTIQQPLSSSNWTDLMVRINSDRFVLNILEKTKSVKTYFNWITKTLELCAQVNDFRNKFQFDFDERMGNDFETTDNIEINDEEILQDTFHTPNRSSFTYSVLFEDCFQTSKVRKKVVDRLIIQLNTWEEQGLRANEIRQWNNYADDQREVARRIWNCVYDRGSLESELPVDELDNHVPLVSDSSESNVVVRNLWTLDGG